MNITTSGVYELCSDPFYQDLFAILASTNTNFPTHPVYRQHNKFSNKRNQRTNAKVIKKDESNKNLQIKPI